MDEERVESLKGRIREVGLRATHPRVIVLAHVEDATGPVTHGDVADALEGMGMDRATVFRNLNDLSDKQLIRRADFGDHVWRYEVAEHDLHVHFVCNGCGIVQCLPKDTVTVHARKGSPRALQTRVEVNLSGACDACS
jgi:Fur family ferric uptake transcriptional regulator